MKLQTIIIGLAIIFITASSGFAQKQDSTKAAGKKGQSDLSQTIKLPSQAQKPAGSAMSPDSLKGFVDMNANGIDDRLEGGAGKQMRKRQRDRFVDTDGDGICDGRESAMGLRKTTRQRRKMGRK